MLSYPQINPVIFYIGPLAIRWYGLMYMLGFWIGFIIIKSEVKRKIIFIFPNQLDLFFLWIMIGVLLGARFGDIFFYHWIELNYYFKNPLQIIAVWNGGMSFHGGLIGYFLASILYLKKQKIPFFQINDIVSFAAPIGLMLGRIGNFINGELYGRITDLPWGIVFPQGGFFPRHPSQLYEAFLEGPVLFFIFYVLKDRVGEGRLSIIALLSYSMIRFLVEFVREPESKFNYILGVFTTGQFLSILQIIFAFYLYKRLSK